MKHVYAVVLCVFLAGFACAQTVELKMPHAGDTEVKGSAPAGQRLRVTRRTKDGALNELTAVTAADGSFEGQFPGGAKLTAGDKVSVAAVNSGDATPLPAVIQVVASNPPILRFAGSLKQTRGAQIGVTVSSNKVWPSSMLGQKVVTVAADDALQFDDTVQINGDLPDASSLTVKLNGAESSAPASEVTIEDPLCEWGRVRCYAYFGVIFSQSNGSYSQADPYLDFDIEWNWWKGKHSILTGYFDSRLTTIPSPAAPSAAGQAATTARTSAAGGGGTQSSPAEVFASSSKSPQVMGGFYYAPYVAPTWTFKDDQYGFFAAGLWKSGVQGKIDGSIDTANLAFPDQTRSVFTFNSVGGRLGFVKWHEQRSEAHDLLSYLDFTVGKYRLYDFVTPGVGGSPDVRHYGLRKTFEGRIKIPSINVRLGIDAGFGQGQNELRFLVTTNAIDMFKTLLGQK